MTGMLWSVHSAKYSIGLFLLYYILRIVGTCAAFYVLFLCRMLGAGDIKLMAVCVGFLGVWRGLIMIFLGFLLAAIYSLWKFAVWRPEGRSVLSARFWRGTEFLFRTVGRGTVKPYPGKGDAAGRLRLGPFLFGGYCLYLMIGR